MEKDGSCMLLLRGNDSVSRLGACFCSFQGRLKSYVRVVWTSIRTNKEIVLRFKSVGEVEGGALKN